MPKQPVQTGFTMPTPAEWQDFEKWVGAAVEALNVEIQDSYVLHADLPYRPLAAQHNTLLSGE